MTKEQAIEVLHELDGSLYETQQVALDMAIKALEQQPSEDCVSRKELYNHCFDATIIGKSGKSITRGILLEDEIDGLPPVTPTHGTCKDCKYLLKDISSFCCRINYRRVTNQNFYCGNYEKREGEVVEMTREIWEERKNPPIDGKTDF